MSDDERRQGGDVLMSLGSHGLVRESYHPGACNIGPREIAKRRAFGTVSLVAAIVVAAGLVVVGAPPLARLILILPLYGAFVGYYQAQRRFCVRFAFEGRSNFGAVGDDVSVAEEEARRADRRAALRMIAICGAGSGIVAVLFALLPL
jgi:hypothetical protein